jgi:hypothetical protein
MNVNKAVVTFLLCGITSLHSMENRSIQAWQSSSMQKAGLPEEQKLLPLAQQSPQSLQPLIRSSVGIMRSGKTAARYLAYTTLPSLVAATDSSDVAPFFSHNAVAIAGGAFLSCYLTAAIVYHCCLKDSDSDRDDSDSGDRC